MTLKKFIRILIKIIKFIISLFKKPQPPKTADNPILVVEDGNTVNPFSRYTGEILKAEGFNEYESKKLAEITSTTLAPYRVVILTETTLTSEQADIFKNYVSNGGHLIAFRPDKQLAPVFGIQDAASIISEGYIGVDPAAEIGNGIVSETMQFHGEADVYNLAGGQTVALLYTDQNTATTSPAVVYNQYNQGLAAAFTYDLNKSVIYTRQGNPDWANQERDGISGIRAADMFAGVNGEPNWIDSTKVSIPQADEQMRLLSHAIERLSSNAGPLPRMWYFPENKDSLLIFTGDGEYTDAQNIDTEVQAVQAAGGNMSIYLIRTDLDTTYVNKWVQDGHEVSVHYDDTAEATSPTYDGMNGVYNTMTQNFIDAYGFAPSTVRNHWITWYGWGDQAQIEADHNVHMDCNYYHFDNGSTAGHFLGDAGMFTGSGIPMKFSDSIGQILDIYQSETQLPDEQWDGQILDKFNDMLDGSIYDGRYVFMNANFHPANWGGFQEAVVNMLNRCRYHRIPVWTAKKTMEFLQLRDSVSFSKITWSNNTLNFQLNTPNAGSGLTFMVPYMHQGLYLANISKDGASQSYSIRKVKGSLYAFVVTDSGAAFNISAVYEQTKPLPAAESMFDNWSGKNFADPGGPSLELGTKFSTTVSGNITGVRVYGVTGESGAHTVTIWDNSTNTIIGGPYTGFNLTGNDDWAVYQLPVPVPVAANTEYTVSITTGTDPEKHYAAINYDFSHAGNNGNHLIWPVNAGVFTSSIGSRPTESYKFNSYLRDVVFVPNE